MGRGVELNQRTDLSPYRRLWCAVVIQAFYDVEMEDRAKQSIFVARQKAKAKRQRMPDYPPTPAGDWIDSDSVKPHSFLWICDVCDLDAAKLRRMSQTIEGRRAFLKKSMRPREEEIA